MDNSINIRSLEKSDISDVLKIYNYHIINGLGNFEEKPLEYEKFKIICKTILSEKLPFLVSAKKNKILGFSYLSKFRNKSGYRFTFENSVYIDKDHIGKGIGSNLLAELIKISKKNSKIKTIVAVIGNNSKDSIKIHKKNGFLMIGSLKKVGFKKNKWLDVTYMQINIK